MSQLSTQDRAYLAKDSYENRAKDQGGESVEIGKRRFYVLEVADNPATGYQGTIYRDEASGEIIVAHRGTETKRDLAGVAYDAAADLAMVSTRVNTQTADAMALTERALALAKETKYQIDGQPAPVTVIGHSLGGTLAQLTAHHYGLKGETFNAYGAHSLVGHRIPEGGAAVTNHVMAGCLVSSASRHYGEVKIYARQSEIDALKAAGYDDSPTKGYINDVRNPLVGFKLIDSHYMSHFVPSVDREGKPRLSVLEGHDASDLAEANLALIGRYRVDVQAIRTGITLRERGPIGNAMDGVDALRGKLASGEPFEREQQQRQADREEQRRDAITPLWEHEGMPAAGKGAGLVQADPKAVGVDICQASFGNLDTWLDQTLAAASTPGQEAQFDRLMQAAANDPAGQTLLSEAAQVEEQRQQAASEVAQAQGRGQEETTPSHEQGVPAMSMG